ncbi:AmmeMemoRadiSam system protein B [Sagittula salina]|uniref:AmmeMemoRadiSam system protein B n=1 Tax=Sagittula salina TaxID=2820268 RepID=A0A940MRB3_9RHOB|nr:AmmeMemoRadiSam system protein B [Sagittula salina]MBP0482622.1 AmmeMemoRadiSam system protein B [Sagittula salina]
MTMTSTGRDPAVAGRFYPGDAQALASQVAALLREAPAVPSVPMAVISPHAGYPFSGALMARALGAARAADPARIVVLSPSHRHVFDGIGIPSQAAFRIPTGMVPMDLQGRDLLTGAALAKVEDAAHDHEHGVEVQLPFLHALFPEVPVLALVLGRVDTGQVATAIDQLAQQTNTLFVLSSDLSHFLPLDRAKLRDNATAARLEGGKGAKLMPEDACGARAITGFLASEHAQGARVVRLGLANSHTTTGDAKRTVGYGAWALTPGSATAISARHRAQLLRAARQVLQSRLATGRPPDIEVASFPPELQGQGTSFVTLEQDGRLRGCIGSLMPQCSLAEDVALNVQRAALEDPRFRPIRFGELERTTIKIAVLSPARRMRFTDQADLESQLVPGRDGLILRDGVHAGTFLPMVWEKLPQPRAFIETLKTKAGLSSAHWSQSVTVDRFHAESFSEG